MARSFAAQINMPANDFRALLFVVMAEASGERFTAGHLRRQMGLSGAAITYTVDRMTDSGFIVREADPTDRRKVILRYSDHGMRIAGAFFTRMDRYTHRAQERLTNADLEAAHRTFAALAIGMSAFRAESHGAASKASRPSDKRAPTHPISEASR